MKLSSKEFNKKYNLNEKMLQNSLVRHVPKANLQFNNAAGKPKKLLNEILKRYFSTWFFSLALVVFLAVLIFSIVISLTSKYSSSTSINNTSGLTYTLLDGKTQIGTSNRTASLPPVFNPFVNLTLGSSGISQQIYNNSVTLWNSDSYFHGLVYKTVFNPDNTSVRLEDGNLYVNAYSFYKADSISIILAQSQQRGLIAKDLTQDQVLSYIEEIKRLNPQINLSTYLGTNSAGVDVWTSSWVGTWNAIRLAVIVSFIQTMIGVFIGAYLGFHAGSLLDTIAMRIISIITSPPTLIWLLIASSIFGTSDLTLAITLIVVGWPGSVGITRLYIITVKDSDFIQASRLVGASKIRLILRHALPAIVGKIANSFVASIPSIILSVSALAFLGFFKGNTANLGSILSSAPSEAGTNIWILVLPVGILLSISLSLQFIALGVHDSLDPKVIRGK